MKSRWFGLLVYVPEQGRFPRGYGRVWVDIWQGGCWCLLVPLNIIVGAVRRVWLTLRRGVPVPADQRDRDIAQMIVRESFQRGYAAGIQFVIDDIKRAGAVSSQPTVSERPWQPSPETIISPFDMRKQH